MRNKGFFTPVRESIERWLPMTLGNLFLFLMILYFLFIVGQTILNNYKSNQSIDVERVKIAELEEEVRLLKNQNNYYQTKSYYEKIAREKLGLKGIGEQMMSLPLDQPEDKTVDSRKAEVKIKTPNYRLWWKYFFSNV